MDYRLDYKDLEIETSGKDGMSSLEDYGADELLSLGNKFILNPSWKLQKRGFECFLRSAQKGNSRAYISIGYCYQMGVGAEQNYKLAFESYMLAKEKGDIAAYSSLSEFYCHGMYVEKDENKAFEYAKKGVEFGDFWSRTCLGIYYLNGVGCKTDYKKAFELLEGAAKYGDTRAMLIVGDLYYNGSGVNKDYEKANEWLLKCKLLSNGEISSKTDELLEAVTKALIQKNENALDKRFYGFTPCGGTAKVKTPLYSLLGEICKDDYLITGKREDYEGKDDPYSLYCYSVILRRECFEKNMKQAIELLRESANKGYPSAHYALAGFYLLYGSMMGDVDYASPYQKVAEHLSLAIEKGDIHRSYFAYGCCLEEGIGVSRDEEKAYEYYYYAYIKKNSDATLKWHFLPDDKKRKILKKKNQEKIDKILASEDLYRITEMAQICINEENDIENAIRLYEKALSLGETKVISTLISYYNSQNNPRAKELLLELAKQGDANAQYEIGFSLLYGYSPIGARVRFVNGDFSGEAWEKWLNLSAEQGHAEALFEMANASATNKELAASYYVRAAQAGKKISYYNAALAYYELKSYDLFCKYIKFVENEYAPAAKLSGAYYDNVLKDYEGAISLYKKAVSISKDEYFRTSSLQRIDFLLANKCEHCGAFFTKESKKGLFGTKTVCSKCGSKFKN